MATEEKKGISSADLGEMISAIALVQLDLLAHLAHTGTIDAGRFADQIVSNKKLLETEKGKRVLDLLADGLRSTQKKS